jgi:hypothetical protein
VIEPNNSYGLVFRIAVSFLTAVAYEYEASDEIIENEIRELLAVVQIRILSFLLRKGVFMIVTLAFCVDMKYDLIEDGFSYDSYVYRTVHHLDS